MLEPPEDLRLVPRVDPFLGTEAADLPPPHDIVRHWWTAKPPIGNTHPGATLPFGMVSACAWSGAYVTGYGRYGLSLTEESPPVMFPDKEAQGIAHFQQSGTGRIRMYYNYLLVTPLGEAGLAELGEPRPLEDERAFPGSYAGTFGEAELPEGTRTPRVEFAVAARPRSAVHRYRFPEGRRAAVAVEVSAGGLLVDGMAHYPQQAEVRLEGPGLVGGRLVMEGIPIHFRVHCPGAELFLWENGEELPGESEYRLDLANAKAQPIFGFGMRGEGAEIEFEIGFSLRAGERAGAALGQRVDLAGASEEAARSWEETLGRIEVEGGSDSQQQQFATALYRSLVKPADFNDENPFRDQDGPFFFDLSTLWDIYKCQIPLWATLWPERASAFVEFLLEVGEREGGFPVSYLMDNTPDRFGKQATGLCHAILEDLRLRGAEADWDRVLSLLWKTSLSGKGRKSRFGLYGRSHLVSPLSHTLDIANAFFAMRQMAGAVGEQPIHDRSAALAVHWRNAFDPVTGLLREDSTYYEGENWNYSFRLLHDMKGRIELAGGEERFIELLDLFFGFRRPTDGQRVHHFEGLNNEPDMEAPFSYLWAGRHDRTAQVVRAAMDQRFAEGPGGLAGNEDSGALSSWYVWNATGLFPVSAQSLILIGSPLFPRSRWHLPDGDFVVEAIDHGPDKVFVAEAWLDDQPLDRAWLRLSEFRGGCTLRLRMSAQRNTWDHRRPPSWG